MSSFIILVGLFPLMSSADSEKLAGVNNSNSTNSINATDQTIPNQYIVMLQNNTTDNAIQLLINELESNAAQIIIAMMNYSKVFRLKLWITKQLTKL